MPQEEFYSESLTRLLIAKHQSKNLWRLVHNLRFHNGRIPGFMTGPVATVHVAIKQAIACFHDTLRTLNYNTSNLHRSDRLTEPQAGPTQSEPRSDMAGMISQLLCQEQVTRDQINKAAWFMASSREWVVARGWGRVDCKMEESVETLMGFRDKVKPIYPEGELTRTVDVFWRQSSYDPPITKMDHAVCSYQLSCCSIFGYAVM